MFETLLVISVGLIVGRVILEFVLRNISARNFAVVGSLHSARLGFRVALPVALAATAAVGLWTALV